MKIYLKEFKSLISDMKSNNQDIEQFYATYSDVRFDVVLDISHVPFELMIGAVKHNWACVLIMHKGFAVEMADNDFYALRKILSLNPSGTSLNSFLFLHNIAEQAPLTCQKRPVNPSHITRFRDGGNDTEGTVFLGWNDHVADGRKARNFDKTEKYFGVKCADYCRKHNISSLWTTPDKVHGSNNEIHWPWD